MTLEELLFGKLTNDTVIAAQLARYNNEPALFEGQAPDDTDNGWNGTPYPRINFMVDWRDDPERKVQGTLSLDVWCLLTTSTPPESIEKRVRELLDGSVFQSGSEPTVGLKWKSSKPVQSEQTEDNPKIGITLTFDMLAFPNQITSEPDPVAALKSWVSAKFAVLQVEPTNWAPTDETPAVYIRLGSMTPAERTAGVIWLEAVIMIHVLAPTPAGRLPWVKKLVEQAAEDRWCKMADDSQLQIKLISADNGADPLQTGQIKLSVRYGRLRSKTSGGTGEMIHHTYLGGV